MAALPVSGLGAATAEQCASCKNTPNQTDQKLKLCAGCKMTWYCNVDCQRSDWDIHKLQCKNIAQLRQGDIFVSTSREESMGLVMLEAQALGMPIIATNSGGSSLLLSESIGQLIDEFNPESIAIGLKEVLNNLSKYKNTSKPKFDFQIEFQKLSILLQDLLA